MEKPTVGRIVHFVPPATGSADFALESGAHLPAVVTEVMGGGHVRLTVFRRVGVPVNVGNVGHDEAGVTSSSWHWPERE